MVTRTARGIGGRWTLLQRAFLQIPSVLSLRPLLRVGTPAPRSPLHSFAHLSDDPLFVPILYPKGVKDSRPARGESASRRPGSRHPLRISPSPPSCGGEGRGE